MTKRRMSWAVTIGLVLLLNSRPAEAAPPIHQVAPGDTLWTLAQRYGTTIAALVQANNLANPNLIHVGQRLVIPSASEERSAPPATGGAHVVEPGDTLSALAQRYGTTIAALAQANGLANPNFIYVGQRLVVPAPSSSQPGLEILPLSVYRGHTFVIQIPLGQAQKVEGNFDTRTLTFTKDEKYHWAVAGVAPWEKVGPHHLALTITEPGGGFREVSQNIYVLDQAFPVERIYLSEETGKLLDPEIVREEARRVSQVLGQVTGRKLWQGTFLQPVEGPVTSPFGAGRAYNEGPVSDYHGGLDISAAEGKEVVAASAGRVALAEELRVRGQAVFIDHGLGVYSAYFHLSEIAVREGETVARGQPIGKVGTTGLSTGPHLHWEMRIGGVAVSPLEWTQRPFPR